VATPCADRLSVEDRTDLAECERQIDEDLCKPWLRIAETLAHIREEKLWRGGKDASFRAYVERRFGLSYAAVIRSIASADVARNLIGATKVGTAVLPTAEFQCRPLIGLEPAQQRRAWHSAVQDAGGKQPTARQVEAVVTRLTLRQSGVAV
jgi:hypothetical protein